MTPPTVNLNREHEICNQGAGRTVSVGINAAKSKSTCISLSGPIPSNRRCYMASLRWNVLLSSSQKAHAKAMGENVKGAGSNDPPNRASNMVPPSLCTDQMKLYRLVSPHPLLSILRLKFIMINPMMCISVLRGKAENNTVMPRWFLLCSKLLNIRLHTAYNYVPDTHFNLTIAEWGLF